MRSDSVAAKREPKTYALPTKAWMIERIDRPMLRALLSIEQNDASIARGVSERHFDTAQRWELIETVIEAREGDPMFVMTIRGDQLLRDLRKHATHSSHIDNIISAHKARKAKT